MYELINRLMDVYAKTSQGQWEVAPILRPDLDDDPMGEYVITSHQAKLTECYFDAEPESHGLVAVHEENAANAEFIELAHGCLPKIAANLERMEKLEYELEKSISESIQFFKHLTEVAIDLEKMQQQVRQMRASKEAEDDVFEANLGLQDYFEPYFAELDRIADSLSPYLNAIRRERSGHVDRLMKYYFGKEGGTRYRITRLDETQYVFLFAKNQRQEGVFLVNDPVMGTAVTRPVFKAIALEAEMAGLTGKRWHVFAESCPYSGSGLEYYPLTTEMLKAIDHKNTFLVSPVKEGLYPYSITSSEVMELVQDNVVEAYLKLSGGFRTTHFLTWEGSMIHDEGCDGQTRTVTQEQFLRDYPDCLGRVWRIDQLTPQRA